MEPGHLRFGGGVGQTILNPIVLLVVLIAGLLILFGSRNRALVAFLSAAILIPTDQILLIGSLHFPMLRVLIVFGIVRLLRAKFYSGPAILAGGWNMIDVAMIVLTTLTAVNGVLQYPESASLIYQMGALYTAFGIYFLLRFLIRNQEDALRTIRVFAYIAVIVAILMTYEQATGHNPIYGLLGGARSAVYGLALEREGRFRATASFGHPILAGTFGAILLPLFFGLWWKDKTKRKIALLGMIAATVIPIAANSSTALFGFAGGLIALCFWPLRTWMRPIRWGIVMTLIGLHIVMKAPVWHLISRIDLSGGSSSYHRFELVNQCILHFQDWWLIGTKSYADWGWDMWDLSNQYVATAETAGLIPLLAFLAIIVFGFKYLGRARKAAKADRKQELFLWALGAALFANCVAFFGISYFDQTIVTWYALLAVIPVAALSGRSAHRRQAPAIVGPQDQAVSVVGGNVWDAPVGVRQTKVPLLLG